MNLVEDDIEWLKANEATTAFIQKHYYNGFHHSYRDGGAGKWTVFYGCTYDLDGCPVNKSSMWSDDYANKVFEKSHQKAVSQVNKLADRDNVKLTQGQFCALVDFEFNTGALASSTLWKKIVSKAPTKEIEEQFLRWVYDDKVFVSGLKNRRLKEIERFNKGDYS